MFNRHGVSDQAADFLVMAALQDLQIVSHDNASISRPN